MPLTPPTTMPAPDIDRPGPPPLAHSAPPATDPSGPAARSRRPLPRWLRGRPEDPRWVRPTLFGLLLATATLYLYGLSASGWANSFYSAAAQAGSQSWKALFFGSSDASNSITVDKPPVSLWVMGLSARLFGVNSWAILAPQALMGVASVGLLHASIRRAFTPAAGLLAGLVLAVTPVATLMFRFNNPDALLVLLMVAAAYTLGRAIEGGTTKWLVATGVLVGFAFLTKMLQALLVVPGFALVYLLAGPRSMGRRIVQLLIGGAAMVVSAGWYIALVELIPAADRPYVGGSQHNSILELTLGYNGFGRLTGNETGSVGGAGGPGGNGMWGQTGIGRLFGSEIGGQIAWLIPAALILAGATFWYARRAPRTDRIRAQLLIWTSWLVVTGLVFSFMAGIFHPYYTVALAPAIAGMVGIGAVILWRRREELVGKAVLAITLAITAAWGYTLLNRTPDWHPWLKVLVLVAGLLAAAAVVLPVLTRKVAVVVAVVAVAAGLAGPIAYSLDTVSSGKSGSIVSAGPAGAFGPGGGGPGGGGPGGGFGRRQGAGNGFQFGTPPGGTGANPAGPGAGGMGGPGGLLNGSDPGTQITALLKADADRYKWPAAAVGSNSASGYQLASGEPVMAVGGFNGSDPSPTLAQFQSYVQAGQIHYFIGGGGFGGGGGLGGRGGSMGGSNESSQISSWVAATFTATTVNGTTVYDLTQPATAS